MTQERWQEVKQLFAVIEELPKELRRTTLDETYANDPELAKYVDGLIESESHEDFLGQGLQINLDRLADILPSQLLVSGKMLSGRFRLLTRLDEGGMGQVWEAYDEHGDKVVALKALLSDFDGSDQFTEILRREVARAQAVSHPNVCRVNDFFEHAESDQKIPFLTMALLRGSTLEDTLARNGALSEKDAWSVLEQCARALEAVHAAGIVHLDVKPRNIMLSQREVGQSPHVTLLDFGIARALHASDSNYGAPFAWTIGYSAPEQRELRNLTPAADVYSFAVVACRVLTGKMPYCGALRDLPWEWRQPIRRALDLDPLQRPKHPLGILTQAKSLKRRTFAGIAATFIVLSGGSVLRRFLPEGGQPSIAVFPIQHSGEGTIAALADGLAEDIIRSLHQTQAGRIVPWASTSRVEGRNLDLAAVSARLHARYVLVGNLKQTSDRFELTIQLLEPAENKLIWLEKYVKPETALGEIPKRVTTAVLAQLGVMTRPGRIEAASSNAQAYRAYLYGRHQLNQRRLASLKLARSYFEQAIQLDPKMPTAHSALAETIMALAEARVVLPKREVPIALGLARRALELDPRSADAYAVLALGAATFDHNFSSAEIHFERALALDPAHVTAHKWRSYVRCRLGEFDGAIADSLHAIELDPLSLPAQRNLSATYFYARQGWKLEQHCEKIREMEPTYVYLYPVKAYAFLFTNRREKAAEFARAVLKLTDPEPPTMRMAAEVLGLLGEVDIARSMYKSLIHLRNTQGYMPAAYLGFLAAAIRDDDEAFTWFEQAWDEQDPYLSFLAVYPTCDALRTDGRYPSLIHRLGLSGAKVSG